MGSVEQGFNIEDYFEDMEPEAQDSQEKLETGVDLSRISTEQIKKVLQVQKTCSRNVARNN